MGNIFRSPCDDGAIRCAPASVPCPRRAGPWILAATILGSGMAIVDGTAVNVALPVLQVELDASVSDVQWIVESYALLLSALLLVGGSLGDRLGRRRVFLAGVVLFTAASVWCGLAPDPSQLILARAVQGVGGALLIPGSLAILAASFRPEDRGRAIGTWSAFTAMAAALGPVLGGWLVEHVSWRWVFFINVPLAVVVVAISLRFVPESRDPAGKRSLDGWGALLAALGLGGLVYGLIESTRLGWGHPVVWISLLGGATALVGFLGVEARGATPMMPLTLFHSRTFRGANGLTFLLYAALGGALFFLPFNLIQVQGYSPTAAGAALLPLILLLFLMSRWSGGLVSRYGARLPLVIGPLIAGVGFFLFALPGVGGSYWTTFFPAVLVLGLGMAISVAPLTTTVMLAVEERHAGAASGINNAVARTAGLVAVAVMGTVVLAAFDRSLDRRLELLPIPQEARTRLDEQRVHLAAARIPEGLSPATATATREAIAGSFVDAFRRVMLLAALLSLAAAVVAARSIETRSPGRPGAVTKPSGRGTTPASPPVHPGGEPISPRSRFSGA